MYRFAFMLRWFVVLLALAPLGVLASSPDSVRVTGFLHGDLVYGGLAYGDLAYGALASGPLTAADAQGVPSLGWAWEETPGARRSVPLAAVLSAAVPGAGQAYNRSWVRAAVYASLEVALWTGYVSWRGQGVDGRDAYQAEAHARWSPHRYGSWLVSYDGYQGDPAALDAALQAAARVDFQAPGAWNARDEEAVRALVAAIRAAEDESVASNGVAFSHQLPLYGSQQYYELIGKYAQFNPGWEDFAAAYPDGTLPDEAAGTTAQFRAYADDHGEANGLLRRASRVSAVIVVNHVLSAFDAMLTARVHNLRLDSNLALRPDAEGTLTPVASVRLQF
ncbi:MAG: hypothetical protein AAGF99_05305 [Bacteroidota bacterium]